MKDLQKRLAFTLAEVLITLGIIGVVAALTIPTLMANYQKVQYVTGLKKAYAEITEALKLMANDHGCPDNLKCTGIFDGDNDMLGNEFKKYIKVAKDCGTKTYNPNDENTKCTSATVDDFYDGSDGRSDANTVYEGYYNFITADGFSVTLANYDGNCESNDVDSAPDLNLSKVCGLVYIDVNGLKGPNNEGRDIFSFLITNGKGPALYPNGSSEMKNTGRGWVNASGTPISCIEENPEGWNCTARIMEQGWQMKY